MDKLQVAKFDGQRDFLIWKVQIQAYLEANGWFGTVDNSLPFPKPELEDKIREWWRVDAKAKAVILNTLETSVVRSVMSLTTAQEMWLRLSTLYESRSKISINLLLQEFHSYKMNDEMDMATHIANVESMARRLGDLGKNVDETEIVTKLLQLPRKYRHLISAWDNLSEEMQTRENLIPRLLKGEKFSVKKSRILKAQKQDSKANVIIAVKKDTKRAIVLSWTEKRRSPKKNSKLVNVAVKWSLSFVRERN